MQLSRREEKELVKVLGKVAPGTELREGLENILSARTGALIVIGDIGEVEPLCNGGFELTIEFSAQRLFELAKMDGAILLDGDLSHILRANVHLVPDPTLPTSETGMRHRTAERVARQTKALVISISQKRDVISLYLDGIKYALQDIRILLAKANQALQTLEKYKVRLDEVLANLSALEFEDLVTLLDVVTALQRSEMVGRVSREIERYISELGTEGRLIRMQLDELVGNTEEQSLMIIKDYVLGSKKVGEVKEQIADLTPEELLDLTEIAQILGYKETVDLLEQPVHPRGYRLLNKIPRLPMSVIEKIVSRFHDLQSIMSASTEELDAVDGVGEIRARAIKHGLQRLKEYNILERYI
ncbi:MAG TPA: DNA integrity scanning diadenylate cyclase DisA [Anaerolineae bacterium]|nr:DNA integrity scanning diadenylate cyclase DisA [Anaerolineae bacterium]